MVLIELAKHRSLIGTELIVFGTQKCLDSALHHKQSDNLPPVLSRILVPTKGYHYPKSEEMASSRSSLKP